jgi:hypothetical protein
LTARLDIFIASKVVATIQVCQNKVGKRNQSFSERAVTRSNSKAGSSIRDNGVHQDGLQSIF